MEQKSAQKISNLNFQALDSLKTENLSKNEMLIFLLPVVGIAIFLFVALSADNEKLLNIGIVLLFGWFALGVLLLITQGIVAFIKGIGSPNYLANFARDNQLHYEKQIEENISIKPGTIFHIDRATGQVTQDLIKGKTGQYIFSCYKYSYCIPNGKDPKFYNAFIVEIELPYEVPHIVIDSLVESVNLDIKSSVLPIQFAESQRINLEGNFSRYFAVYSPDMEQVYTLSILTPDVMEILMQFGSKCDIEMVGNRLYFYWPDMPQNRYDYEKIFQSVDSVWDEVGNKLMRKEASIQPSNIPLTHTVQHNVSQLTPKYSPLTKKTARIGFVSLVLVGYVSLQIFPLLNDNKGYIFGIDPFLFIFIAVPFTVAGFIGYKLYRQRKLLREIEEHNRH